MPFTVSFLVTLYSLSSLTTANAIGSIEARAECYDSAVGETCAAHGVLKDPKRLVHTGYSGHIDAVATSVENCWAVARQYPDRADSFSWNSNTQACKLFTKSLADQKYVKGKSTETYYDVGCFNCLDTCPRPLGENQLVNGGFEQFSNSIYPWESISPFKVVKPGLDSKQAFGLSNPHFQANAYQNALVCENDYYIYTLNHKFVYTNPKYGGLNMDFGSIYYSTNTPKNNTWNTAAMLGTPYQGDRRFYFSVDPGSKPIAFYVDNVKVYRVRNPVIAPSTPNQISNGNFESGTTNHFNISDNCSLAPQGFDSDYSLVCDAGSKKIGRIMPSVGHLAANTAYVLSFDYQVIYAKEAYCYLYADVGPRLVYDFKRLFPDPANATWVHREIPFLVDNADGFVHFRSTAVIPSKHCLFYFDNFSVKKASI